eukprot:sb/3466867/
MVMARPGRFFDLPKYVHSYQFSGNMKQAEIGTGMAAERIREKGYTHIDAFDPNKKSCQVAQRKGIYERIYLTDASPKAAELKLILDNTYDLIVSAGTFWVSPSYPGVYMLEELARVIKPGGKILLVVNEEYIQGEWQDWGVVRDLEKRGILKARPVKLVPNYRMNAAVSDTNQGKPPNGAVVVYDILNYRFVPRHQWMHGWEITDKQEACQRVGICYRPFYKGVPRQRKRGGCSAFQVNGTRQYFSWRTLLALRHAHRDKAALFKVRARVGLGLGFGLGLEMVYRINFELAKTVEWFDGYSRFSESTKTKAKIALTWVL